MGLKKLDGVDLVHLSWGSICYSEYVQ